MRFRLRTALLGLIGLCSVVAIAAWPGTYHYTDLCWRCGSVMRVEQLNRRIILSREIVPTALTRYLRSDEGRQCDHRWDLITGGGQGVHCAIGAMWSRRSLAQSLHDQQILKEMARIDPAAARELVHDILLGHIQERNSHWLAGDLLEAWRDGRLRDPRAREQILAVYR